MSDESADPIVPVSIGSILHQAEEQLPELLEDADGWNTLLIDYDSPEVERLWRPFKGDYRLYLHRIWPCSYPEKPLFHPHPWPSAVRLVKGEYEMGVGWSPFREIPKPAAVLLLAEGSEYVMDEPNGWHYVCPVHAPVLSIMVSGKPWDRWAPKAEGKLQGLKPEIKSELLSLFREEYP